MKRDKKKEKKKETPYRIEGSCVINFHIREPLTSIIKYIDDNHFNVNP